MSKDAAKASKVKALSNSMVSITQKELDENPKDNLMKLFEKRFKECRSGSKVKRRGSFK